MQAPNAQGIMGLMAQGRAPQGAPQGAPQQAMPSPMKASPMAGLGSVEDRVAAYRGNPAPLQQRYQMSQDLLDLLALQKLKSEKDAAARQMQMAMAQQSAMQGQEPMTIAQQREKEVMDMTKNELAQQRGDTAQHQQDQQQEAMKRAMSGGIAAAPGAAAAAQPKAMASGGIVAFDGTAGSSVEDPRRKRLEGESFSDFRRRMFDLDLQLQREKNAQREADREAERQQRLAERGNEVIPPSPFLERPPLPRPGAQQAAPQGVAPSDADLDAAANSFKGLPSQAGAPRPVPQVVQQGAPAQQAAPGIAGLPQGSSNGNKLWEIAMQQAQMNPATARADEEKRIEGKLAIDPEQLKAMQEANAYRKRAFEEQYNPERQRNESLTEFLLGAGGRRYNVLGSGAQAARAYDAKQRASELKEFEDMQKGIMEPFNLKRGVVEKGITAGQEAGKQAGEGQRAGLAAGYHMYNTDTQAAIERAKASISAETNRIQREGLDLSKAQSIYSTAMGRVQELERKLDADFAKQNGMLLMAEQSGKMEPAQKQQLEVARAQLELQKDGIRKELEPVLASARAKLGIGGNSTAGWGELKTK